MPMADGAMMRISRALFRAEQTLHENTYECKDIVYLGASGGSVTQDIPPSPRL